MAITGYNLDNSIINRWQIENSWGADRIKIMILIIRE